MDKKKEGEIKLEISITFDLISYTQVHNFLWIPTDAGMTRYF